MLTICPDEKREFGANSDTSSTSSVKAPRTPRFAEATSVYSPVDPEKSHGQLAGFGYINSSMDDDIKPVTVTLAPMTPRMPLKSSLKSPGVSRTFANPLSPTFREEDLLEKREAKTSKQQKRDLVGCGVVVGLK